MSTVLVIADTHIPFVHPRYLDFCRRLRDKYKPKHVVHIGDVLDEHAVSIKYLKNPNGQSAREEWKASLVHTKRWHEAFPKTKVCIGNHDKRYVLAARAAGLNDECLRGFAEIWRTPTWEWALQHEIDGVLYEHGTGSSGGDAAIQRAMAQRQSLVMGHTHSFAGVKYHSNPKDIIFGMNVGCGLDIKAYAFEYGEGFVNRPVLGAGVVFDGELALFLPMPLGTRRRPPSRS